ncbi:MAG: D-aminoacyl-tRNA deacylase, partial [Chlamydiota bacterium]
MKILIQRVKEAQVISDGELTGAISRGILVFFAVHKDDSYEDTTWLAEKLINLRLFQDQNDKMNLSIKDIEGEILIVSQFTLYGTCLKGRRPEFTQSAPPQLAETLYNKFVEEVSQKLG